MNGADGANATIPGAGVLHLVASTGRTATTFIAHCLNRIAGVGATHEGHLDGDKDSPALLPLINLDNAAMYKTPAHAADVVADKRSQARIDALCAAHGTAVAVDVAYYNAPMLKAYLAAHPRARAVGIIRDATAFVRSATHLQGEDPLPVGWADPGKPLSPRERFIAMGRLRPRPGTAEAQAWGDWDAIQRNIWLWAETNRLLIDARDAFPDRVTLIPFETMATDAMTFWKTLARGLDIHLPADFDTVLDQAGRFQNRKTTGYQAPAETDWPEPHRRMLAEARREILERWGHGQ